MKVPASPASRAFASASRPMAAGFPVASLKRHAASILGPIEPAGKSRFRDDVGLLDAGLGRFAALEQGVPAERGNDPHRGSPSVANSTPAPAMTRSLASAQPCTRRRFDTR